MCERLLANPLIEDYEIQDEGRPLGRVERETGCLASTS